MRVNAMFYILTLKPLMIPIRKEYNRYIGPCLAALSRRAVNSARNTHCWHDDCSVLLRRHHHILYCASPPSERTLSYQDTKLAQLKNNLHTFHHRKIRPIKAKGNSNWRNIRGRLKSRYLRRHLLLLLCPHIGCRSAQKLSSFKTAK